MISGLRPRGHEFAVVTRQDRPDWPAVELHRNIRIYRFPFWGALDQRNPRVLHRLMHEVGRLQNDFAPDIVHLNTVGPSVFFYLALRQEAPIPTLLSLHGPGPRQTLPDTVPGRTIRSVQWIATNSFAILAEVHRLVAEVKDRSSCVHYGLDSAPEPTHGTPHAFGRLLCLGRLVRDKGFDLALAVLPQIVKRFPDVRLIVAGDGPARGELERQAAQLGVAGCVDFIGRVEPARTSDLIGSSHIVIMPSRWLEAFGLVALEAARMGRPVVAARVGGLPEIICDGQTGLLVARESAAELARAITFLLEHPEIAARMGRAARRRARTVFSLEKSLDAYEALYENLVTP